jgi:hypothetical protein
MGVTLFTTEAARGFQADYSVAICGGYYSGLNGTIGSGTENYSSVKVTDCTSIIKGPCTNHVIM